MPRVWALIYMLVLGATVWIGHAATAASRTGELHPTVASGCVFAFALTLVATLLGFRYAQSKGASFRIPSLGRRFPFIWWEDPLQVFLGFTLAHLGLAVGSSFAARASGTNGVWMFILFSSIFGGYAVGQVIGYVIYRQQIQRA